MGPSQICGCPFREPRVFEIAHVVTVIHVEYQKKNAHYDLSEKRYPAIPKSGG